MNESKPVITPIERQTWIVGEDFKVEVPISNNPDKAWAWGELYGGAYGHWVEDRSMLIVEGHADKEKSGHFIVFATKGSHKVQHTIYYDAVLKSEPILPPSYHSSGIKGTDTGNHKMYDINALAVRVANRTRGASEPHEVASLPDETLRELAKAAAVDEITEIFREVSNQNEALLQSFGLKNTKESLAIAFDNIGTTLLGDDVINRAVELLKQQEIGLKEIMSLGYNVIATVYQTDTFKASIQPHTNGKILIRQNGRVICSFHAEKAESGEGKVSSSFSMLPYSNDE